MTLNRPRPGVCVVGPIPSVVSHLRPWILIFELHDGRSGPPALGMMMRLHFHYNALGSAWSLGILGIGFFLYGPLAVVLMLLFALKLQVRNQISTQTRIGSILVEERGPLRPLEWWTRRSRTRALSPLQNETRS